jgi:hypothetical protein
MTKYKRKNFNQRKLCKYDPKKAKEKKYKIKFNKKKYIKKG